MEGLLLGVGVLACPVGMAAMGGIAWSVTRRGGPTSARVAAITRRGCAMSLCHPRGRATTPDDAPVPARTASPQTFVFADLAGFTALTEAHGDDHAADLALRFADDVDELLAGHGAQRVKCIGDGLMIRVGDPTDALGLGVRIAGEIGARHGFPLVRVGIHTGPAVERDGDWYGAAVNVAARIAAMAKGGEVLVSDQTRQAVGEPEGVVLDELADVGLKNVARPVRLFAARPAGEDPRRGLSIDPVCRMAVEVTERAGLIRHDGVDYVFCSLDCAGAFADDPEAHLSLVDRATLHSVADPTEMERESARHAAAAV